jgi:Fe2+ or Zn2+ uptake regulation protein
MPIVGIADGERVLRRAGRRLTRQRQIVLEILKESRVHLDAETIHRRAKQCDPRLSLSTVYRTLNLLKELGLVEERCFERTHHHFELKTLSEHYHFTCLSCGRVSEFQNPDVEGILRTIAVDERFRLEKICICLSGYCTACREKSSRISG